MRFVGCHNKAYDMVRYILRIKLICFITPWQHGV